MVFNDAVKIHTNTSPLLLLLKQIHTSSLKPDKKREVKAVLFKHVVDANKLLYERKITAVGM